MTSAERLQKCEVPQRQTTGELGESSSTQHF